MEEVWMCKTSVLWAITYGLYGYICIRPPHLRPIMPLQGQIFSIWPLARVCLRIQLCYLFLSTNSSLSLASFLFVHFNQSYEKKVSQPFMFFGLLEHLVCLVCLHPSWTQTQSMTLTRRRKQPNMPPAWKNWILQNTKGLYAEKRMKRRVCACKWSDEGGIEGIPFTISLGGCGKLCAADDRDAGCKLFKLPVYRAFLTLLYLPYVSQRPWKKKEEKEYTVLP